MTIDRPLPQQIPDLRRLWKEAFGDTDEFLDIFFHRAFSYDRCRCVSIDGEVVSALYWFDCTWQNKKLAYIYAVATAKSHKGKGLCRALMESSHRQLQKDGYDGAILCPQNEGLFAMYGKFGYRTCSYVQNFSCVAGGEPIELKEATPAEYAAVRCRMLPENSVLQEGVTLDFFGTYARFYIGSDIALAAYPDEGELVVCELLGAPESAPRVLAALGFAKGHFRAPGNRTPFAMYLSLTEDTAMPAYFGLNLN